MPEMCPCCGCSWRKTPEIEVSNQNFLTMLKLMVSDPDDHVEIQFEVEED